MLNIIIVFDSNDAMPVDSEDDHAVLAVVFLLVALLLGHSADELAVLVVAIHTSPHFT